MELASRTENRTRVPHNWVVLYQASCWREKSECPIVGRFALQPLTVFAKHRVLWRLSDNGL
jgi:hypothetical protein